MNNKEYFEWLAQSKKDKKYFSDMTSPFNDYIDNPDGKYVVTITKSQYVFYADFGNDHALMAAELTRRIRPDLKIDGWGNAYNREEDFRLHNIFIFGYPNYSLVSIPEKEMLSIEQFKELEKILLNIKEHNENKEKRVWELFIDAPLNTNIESGNYENKIDELLGNLENYITDDYEKPNEVIIGKKIVNKITL